MQRIVLANPRSEKIGIGKRTAEPHVTKKRRGEASRANALGLSRAAGEVLEADPPETRRSHEADQLTSRCQTREPPLDTDRPAISPAQPLATVDLRLKIIAGYASKVVGPGEFLNTTFYRTSRRSSGNTLETLDNRPAVAEEIRLEIVV